ncbi:MAG: adenine phosphoribosyltransferase [Lentisphaeria bacterium]
MPTENLKQAVRDIPDFPKPGIIFKDITPLLRDPALFREAVDLITAPWENKNIDAVAAIDARGFILGGAVAYNLNVGFIPLRKKGKLPWDIISAEYALEYGTDAIEIHADAVQGGQQILIVDDLLATGGTAGAAAKLIEDCGGKVAGVEFLIELGFLKGRKALGNVPVRSLIVED